MGPHASSIVTSLRKIVRRLRVSARATEIRAGVSSAQLFVLSQLASEPALSIRELAERTLTDPSSVSVVVAKLAEGGLVSRTTAHADKRRAQLAITAKGRAVVGSAPDVPQTKMFAAIDAMAEPRRRAIAHALEELVVALGAESTEPGMFFEDERAPTPKRATKKRARPRAR